MLDINELRDHYRSLHTDELLAISVSGELTEIARTLLSAELDRRGVKAEDYEFARETQATMAADRERTREEFSTRVKVRLGLVAFIALLALIIGLIKRLNG